MAQAHETAERLVAAHGWEPDAIEIIPISTSGDAIVDRPLSEFGGKGLFTQEIERALLDGTVDLAVHSAKDMPTELPAGLAIVAALPREDVRDAFLSSGAASLADLPEGAVFGTSSLRRKAMVLMLRPDIRVVEFRGNVATRLRKLSDGVADATMLAAAGLRRLGLAEKAAGFIPTDMFLPAVGQGAIALEARAGDEWLRALLAPINDPATFAALSAERAYLAVLDGSCRTPIGGLAEIDGGYVRFRGIIVSPDGVRSHRAERRAPVSEAEALGRDVGVELVAAGGPDFFAGVAP